MRAAVVAVALVAAAGSVHASVIGQWNLVVVQNLDINQEVEGRTFVGGNLSTPASNYGTMLTPASSWLGIDVLAVAGNINGGNLQMQAGNLRRGGSRSGSVNFNGGGTEIIDAALASQVPGIASDLASTSAFLRTLPSDSSLTLPAGQPGPARFNATPGGDGIAVFDISGDALFESSLVQQIELLGAASSIIINVGGTDINWANGNMVGAWLNASVRATALWNFYEATSIVLDRNFNGAVLAPNAHLRNTTAIDGSVFVKSMTANGEVHLPNYTGFVPAPGAAGVLALAGVIAARRRRG